MQTKHILARAYIRHYYDLILLL